MCVCVCVYVRAGRGQNGSNTKKNQKKIEGRMGGWYTTLPLARWNQNAIRADPASRAGSRRPVWAWGLQQCKVGWSLIDMGEGFKGCTSLQHKERSISVVDEQALSVTSSSSRSRCDAVRLTSHSDFRPCLSLHCLMGG